MRKAQRRQDDAITALADEVIEIRKQLLRRGYRVLPCKAKKPIVEDWNSPEFVTKQLTDGPKGTAIERAARWRWRFPDAPTTGVRIEDGLVPLDFDINDRDIIGQMLAELAAIAPDVHARAPRRFGGGVKSPCSRVSPKAKNPSSFGRSSMIKGNTARSFRRQAVSQRQLFATIHRLWTAYHRRRRQHRRRILLVGRRAGAASGRRQGFARHHPRPSLKVDRPVRRACRCRRMAVHQTARYFDRDRRLRHHRSNAFRHQPGRTSNFLCRAV